MLANPRNSGGNHLKCRLLPMKRLPLNRLKPCLQPLPLPTLQIERTTLFQF